MTGGVVTLSLSFNETKPKITVQDYFYFLLVYRYITVVYQQVSYHNQYKTITKSLSTHMHTLSTYYLDKRCHITMNIRITKSIQSIQIMFSTSFCTCLHANRLCFKPLTNKSIVIPWLNSIKRTQQLGQTLSTSFHHDKVHTIVATIR